MPCFKSFKAPRPCVYTLTSNVTLEEDYNRSWHAISRWGGEIPVARFDNGIIPQVLPTYSLHALLIVYKGFV